MDPIPQNLIKQEFLEDFPGTSLAKDADKINREFNSQGKAKKKRLEDLVDPPALEKYIGDMKTPLVTANMPECLYILPRHSIYQFNWKLRDIHKNVIPVSRYRNRVCIIVNVASRSWFTHSNYEMLNELHDKYAKSRGLSILAFPCNQFGGQEPGASDDIWRFCQRRNVKFDVFCKVEVNGYNAHPLWLYLQSMIEGPRGHRIKWNFTKFVISRLGEPVERFTPLADKPKLLGCLGTLW